MYIPKRKDADDIAGNKGPITGDQDFEGFEAEAETDEVPEFLRSKSNIERMEKASEYYSQKATDLIKRLMTAQDPNLIDRNTLLQVVKLQRARFYGCLSLPFSLFFFMVFSLSAYLHEDITNVYMIESGLREALGVGIDEVEDIPQVWDWMQGVIIPTLFNQTDIYGSMEKNKTFWSRVLTYNQLQGPMVLEQSRSPRTKCNDGEGIVGDMTCYPRKESTSEPIIGRNVTVQVPEPAPGEYNNPTNLTLEDRIKYYDSSFSVSESRRLRIMRQEYMPYLPADTSGGKDLYKVFIYPNTPYNLITEHISYLYQKGWLDAQTKEIVFKSLLLNSEVGRPRLEQLHVVIRFSRGGGMFARITLESLFLEMWDGGLASATGAADVCWFGCLCVITGVEFLSLFRALRNRECRKSCTKFWTILQWFIIICGWLCLLGYAYQEVLRGSVVEALKDVIANQIEDLPPEFNKLGPELHTNTDSMVVFTTWFRILIAEYHLVLMFRFFTAFHAQPRLGVVTSTLEASVIDIIHFLVVLLPTFMAYAISGCFIFGRRMEEFSTFDAAIGVCFKMAMEGEYDWDELSEEHYWTAAFWVWTFMLLLVLLMLNMVLAIVMDVYTEMRKNSGQSETVWTTIFHLLQRMYWWRRWISNREIAEKLEGMGRLLTREELLEEFPGMCDQQLFALVQACRYQIEAESTKNMELKDSMKMTMAVKLSIDKVNEVITGIQEQMMQELDPAAGNGKFQISDEERGWLQETSEQMAAQNHWMLSVQWQLQQLQWQWQSIEALHGQDAHFGRLGKAHPKPEEDIII
mmetsp:Transcript_35602/g.62922  ORF Transcript_35602/g.62922 Transcript_35602/m.62922 type:complete len:803 (+) Transcript_35602:87-2495(+)